ncbi:MAG TPA: 2-phosphosulfolactate phosphatase [Bacteroidetes bacterium]|nr:2-phosphosulfolactate phosphatase [Bacteroidota bacterium]
MTIETYPFADVANAKDISGKTVVVIDVLRATSVMITALENGAKKIIPVLTNEMVLSEAKKYKPETSLLCGERNAKKIDGFDLGNSPLEFIRETVEGKTLIMTTTNGTKAMKACQKTKEVFIGAFLNVDAVTEQVKNNQKLILLCAGTNGRFSLDDGLCAGMIIDKLSEFTSVKTDDLGHILRKAWKSGTGDLKNRLRNCRHLNFLVENGFEKDVEFCLQRNSSPVVPVYDPEKGIVYV